MGVGNNIPWELYTGVPSGPQVHRGHGMTGARLEADLKTTNGNPTTLWKGSLLKLQGLVGAAPQSWRGPLFGQGWVTVLPD